MDSRINLKSSDNNSNITVLEFTGNINSEVLNKNKMSSKIDWLIKEKKMKIFIFNFLDATGVDSSTIGLTAKIAKSGKKVKIVCKKDSLVYQVFQAVRLFSIIPRFDDIDKAFEKTN